MRTGTDGQFYVDYLCGHVDKKRAALSDEIRDAAILHVFPPMAGG